MLRRGGVNFFILYSFFLHHGFVPLGFPGEVFNEAVSWTSKGSIMNNIMDVHKLSINLDINRYIEYTLMYIGYECVGYKCVGYVFIYTLMYSCIKPYK